MRILYWLIVIVGLIYFSLTLYTYVVPLWACTILSWLAFVFLVIAFLVTAVVGFVRWRRVSPRWMVPTMLCLAFGLSGLLTPRLGHIIADRKFERHQAEYFKIVEGVKNGTLPCGPTCSDKLTVFQAASLPSHTRALIGARCDNGEVVVAFLADTDVPLLHEGYLFKGYEENSACFTDAMRPEKKWAYVRQVAGRWYHFSDQPGL